MNENSITNYRCNSQFQLPQPPKLRAESCLFDKLPLEVLCEIFKHLEEQDRYTLITTCLKWKNCIISQSIHQANARIVTVAKSLCKVVAPEHIDQKALLKNIKRDSSILNSDNLPSTRTRFDVKFTQMIECMATLELDDLDLMVFNYLNGKRNTDHGEIVFKAILKKIDPLPAGVERLELLTKLAQDQIQCGFAKEGLNLATPLLNQEGFKPLEIVAMFCEEGLVEDLISFLKNVKDPQIVNSIVRNAAFLLVDNYGLKKFVPFYENLSESDKRVALYGAVLGSARSGCFDRALFFFKMMPEQDYYLGKIFENLRDLPKRQKQFRDFLFRSI